MILEDLLTDKKTKKQWAYCRLIYCLPSLSASKGKFTSLSEETVEDESEWAEKAVVEPEVAAIEAVEAMREQVDCVDGKSSTSRENQLGNARGTANPDAKVCTCQSDPQFACPDHHFFGVLLMVCPC